MSKPLKCLSIRQPFADAILYGPKRAENREVRVNVPEGGLWIAVHTGKNFFFSKRDWREERGYLKSLWDGILDDLDEYVYGSIIGIARITQCLTPDEYAKICSPEQAYWAHGPHIWVLEDVWALPTPIPYRGRQGLFNIDSATARSIRAQYALAMKAKKPTVDAEETSKLVSWRDLTSQSELVVHWAEALEGVSTENRRAEYARLKRTMANALRDDETVRSTCDLAGFFCDLWSICFCVVLEVHGDETRALSQAVEVVEELELKVQLAIDAARAKRAS